MQFAWDTRFVSNTDSRFRAGVMRERIRYVAVHSPTVRPLSSTPPPNGFKPVLDKTGMGSSTSIISGVMHGDLGIFAEKPNPRVRVRARFKAMLELGVCAMIFAVAVGIPVGVLPQ